ncbi:hypothetical protein KP509_26G050200 [Ceratopteris richardii]|uniref:Uncharacterized protein n=1 Tax=Ceratopteris richardii TaxID=49495 RepID=A0A8T2RMY7_CERRI|nr:hypothetical protein KP509_26G050200 [Ceratopteris richardii]
MKSEDSFSASDLEPHRGSTIPTQKKEAVVLTVNCDMPANGCLGFIFFFKRGHYWNGDSLIWLWKIRWGSKPLECSLFSLIV